MMFKAEGHTVEKKLQAYVLSLGLPFKVTVVTGPSGSYREEHIIAFFDKHLEPTLVLGNGGCESTDRVSQECGEANQSTSQDQ